ncbi:hypothetical protein HDU76_008211, partial [Blyttiomyces sp. JEL0837]
TSSDIEKAVINSAEYGHIDLVQYFLQQPRVNINTGTIGSRIIEQATHYGQEDIGNLFLDRSNKRVISSSKKASTFEYPFKYYYFGLIQLFLQNAEIRTLMINNRYRLTYLTYAARGGWLHVIVLFDPLYNFNWTPHEKNEAFISACICGRVNVVKNLLNDTDVDVPFEQNKAFKTASTYNKFAIVKLLITLPNVDLTDSDPTCKDFLETIRRGHLQVIKLVLPKIVSRQSVGTFLGIMIPYENFLEKKRDFGLYVRG